MATAKPVEVEGEDPTPYQSVEDPTPYQSVEDSLEELTLQPEEEESSSETSKPPSIKGIDIPTPEMEGMRMVIRTPSLPGEHIQDITGKTTGNVNELLLKLNQLVLRMDAKDAEDRLKAMQEAAGPHRKYPRGLMREGAEREVKRTKEALERSLSGSRTFVNRSYEKQKEIKVESDPEQANLSFGRGSHFSREEYRSDYRPDYRPDSRVENKPRPSRNGRPGRYRDTQVESEPEQADFSFDKGSHFPREEYRPDNRPRPPRNGSLRKFGPSPRNFGPEDMGPGNFGPDNQTGSRDPGNWADQRPRIGNESYRRESQEISALSRAIPSNGVYQGRSSNPPDISSADTSDSASSHSGSKKLLRGLWETSQTYKSLTSELREDKNANGAYPHGNRGNLKTETMRLDKFDGSMRWEEYKTHFVGVCSWNQWTQREAVQALRISLKGEAALFVNSLPNLTSMSLDDLSLELEKRFGRPRNVMLDKMALKERKLKPGENIYHFSQDLRRLADEAYFDPITAEEMALEAFWAAMPIFIKDAIASANPRSFQECVSVAARVMSGRTTVNKSVHVIGTTNSGFRNNGVTNSNSYPRGNGYKTYTGGSGNSLPRKYSNSYPVNQNGNKMAVTPSQNQKPIQVPVDQSNDNTNEKKITPNSGSGVPQVRCWNCGEWGHVRGSCPQPLKIPPPMRRSGVNFTEYEEGDEQCEMVGDPDYVEDENGEDQFTPDCYLQEENEQGDRV